MEVLPLGAAAIIMIVAYQAYKSWENRNKK